MTADPTSTQQPSTAPPIADHLNLAERYSSYAEYAASTASVPQTAASSLDVARFHAFTGELTMSVDPAVRLYLDGGTVYHAERDGDPDIGRRLLDAGVLDTVQLQRGVVRVGDVDHLGRLFDRDQTIDRDAVMVVVEHSTNDLLQEIANSVIATVRATAYRHHPSGVHRWFVAPVEPAKAQRPASGVMQVDRSVVEELPHLGTATGAPADLQTAVDQPMSIEWAEPDPTQPATHTHAGNVVSTSTNRHLDIQAELDRFDADRADWTSISGGIDPDSLDAIPSPVGEFHIVWPDGTRETPASMPDGLTAVEPADEPIVPESPVASEQPITPEPPVTPEPHAALADSTTPMDPSLSAAPPAPQPDPLDFATEPIRIDQIPEPDATVPEDVAAAVRRALQAIGAETAKPGLGAPTDARRSVAMPELSVPTFAPPATPAPAVESSDGSPTPVMPAPEPIAPTPAEPLGFAPPTMDMRAELVHQRAAAAASTSVAPEDPAPKADSPESAETDEATERRGALRRLIDNLRGSD